MAFVKKGAGGAGGVPGVPVRCGPPHRRGRGLPALIALVGALVLTVLSIQVASAGTAVADSTANLAACPFWASGITPPPRSDTPWTRPLQTAGAVDFSSRLAAPTMTGTLTNGQVTLTVSRVPGAVAYRVWRDGVAVAWISDYGQPSLTATDTAPCQDAYYTVAALVDNNDDDASMGQLSSPYWLGSDGVVAPGAGTVPVGTTITMMVTSYDDIGFTATGYSAQLGVCAVDPRVIPWGTYFTVPDYGTCYAGDIGTWIQNDTVDIWLPGSQANGWGVQHRTITVIANPYGSSTPPSSPPTTPPPTTLPPTSPPGGCTAPAYQDSAIYVGGDQVSYQGHDWTAQWWTQGEAPSATGTGVWTDDGACGGSSTSQPTPPPTSTPTPPPTVTPTPPGSGGTCATAWSAATAYTIGDRVSYDGHDWTATYYSTGAVPDAPTSWAVWQDAGGCTT